MIVGKLLGECLTITKINELNDILQQSNNIEDIISIFPKFKSKHINGIGEISYAAYNSPEYFEILKTCARIYFSKLKKNFFSCESDTELLEISNLLACILPNPHHNKKLRNGDLNILSNILDLENQGIFIFNTENIKFDENDKICVTPTELKNKIQHYINHGNMKICIIFNQNDHWRCLVIQDNLAIYLDGTMTKTPKMVVHLCDLLDKKMDILGYTYSEQKDKNRCGLYALRTALFMMKQSSSDFINYFDRIKTLKDIVEYVEDKTMRNIIKTDLFRYNEPEKYQEKMIECFILYGLLKYQRHILDSSDVDLSKLFNTLTEKNLFNNFEQLCEDSGHIDIYPKYVHIIKEMNFYLKKNMLLKKSICEKVLLRRQTNKPNMRQSLCQGLVKFPVGNVTFEDFIKNGQLEVILIRKKGRLNRLMDGEVH